MGAVGSNRDDRHPERLPLCSLRIAPACREFPSTFKYDVREGLPAIVAAGRASVDVTLTLTLAMALLS